MGRKKQKVRWTSLDQEGFFPNDNEVSEVSFDTLRLALKLKDFFCWISLSTILYFDLFQQSGNKDYSFSNTSNPNYYNPSKRRDLNKRPKYRLSQERDSKNPNDTPVTGCDSKDLQDFLRDCTTHENTSICDDIPDKSYKNSNKTLKMDQTKSESINDGTSNSDLNESNANAKDCDTNSEHSSMMNGSTHSSYNNRYLMKL